MSCPPPSILQEEEEKARKRMEFAKQKMSHRKECVAMRSPVQPSGPVALTPAVARGRARVGSRTGT